MNKLDSYFASQTQAISAAVGYSMDGKWAPLFEFNMPDTGEDRLLTQNIHLKLPPQVHGFTPIMFFDPADQRNFLAQLGLAEEAEVSRQFFPTRKSFYPAASDGKPESRLCFAGAEINLTVRLADETTSRSIMYLRDGDVSVYPNCFCSPTGLILGTPDSWAANVLNRKIGIITKHEGQNYFLSFSNNNETGISEQEKRQQTEFVLKRIQGKYGHHFGDPAIEDIRILNVPLVPDPGWAGHENNVTITGNIDGQNFGLTSSYRILYVPINHGFGFQTNKTFPESAIDSTSGKVIPLTSLEHGKTIFCVDAEPFNRDIHFLSREELAHAMKPAGSSGEAIHTPWGPQRGVFLPSTVLALEPELAEVAPALLIKKWTPDGPQNVKFVANPDFASNPKSGPYLLVSADAGISPSLPSPTNC